MPYAIRLASRNGLRFFAGMGGLMRASQAVGAGIFFKDLHAMTNAGMLEKVGRGMYRLGGKDGTIPSDLAVVSLRIPRGVICLLSALDVHEITTHVPHGIDVALPMGARKPLLDHPPINVHRYSRKHFSEGIETHKMDGIPVRVYSPERTVADCFKFRNRIGLDTALEALKMCRAKRHASAADFLKYARLCRVERVMRPYLEVIL